MKATKTASKKRRSERLPAAVRLLLTVLGPSGAVVLKEVVTTVEVSQYGARLRGLRPLELDWRGELIQLSSGRRAPFRVAWQTPSPAHPSYFDTGVELLPNLEYWDRKFAPAPDPPSVDVLIEDDVFSADELVRELSQGSSQEEGLKGDQLLEALWCTLVEQLAERKAITRAELVASLRKIAQQSTAVSKV